MTDTTEAPTDDFELPKSSQRSKLDRAPKSDEADDVTTAADRIAAFWRKYPNGSILTEVESTRIDTVDHLPYFTHTVRAFVRKDGTASLPDATAHATRSDSDPDPVTAAYPQETAETAAVSRALRNAGILTKPRKKRG